MFHRVERRGLTKPEPDSVLISQISTESDIKINKLLLLHIRVKADLQ